MTTIAATTKVGSIRAQANKEKATSSTSAPPVTDRSRMNKEVVKAVLASPLTVPWRVLLLFPRSTH